MIPKPSKFPMRSEFLRFRTRARQLTTVHTRIYLLKSNTPSRLAVVVPLKVNKRATARNSFKRLVYSVVWKKLWDKNLDCVIVFKPIALIKGKSSLDLITHELSQITDLR